jgi:hypothetical protein
MVAPLTGLTGIAGFQVQINQDAQATPEERYGDVADPRHAVIGEQAEPYSWESKATQAASMHGPYGPENQMLGDEFWFLQPAGEMTQDPAFDRTPSRRAGPWPKGIASGPVPGDGPDDIGNQLRQSYGIHSINLCASVRMLTGFPAVQDEWQELVETNPGHSDLQPLPRQAMSSGFMWGTRDRTQSMARQNEYGFDSAHMHRRWATGPIPGNTMWLKPGGRPLAKTLAGPARPAIGVDSPFAGDDLGQSFDINGAYLQNVPMEYVAPVQPNLAPPLATNEALPVVEWY